MKWALVVYFLVNGAWQTAEALNYDGCGRMHFNSQEICEQYAKHFNDVPHSQSIKGVCELDNIDEVK